MPAKHTRRSAQKRRSARKFRTLSMEKLDARIVLAASLGWDGPGMGSASLTYHIAEAPSALGLEQEAVEAAIESALGAWSEVADITFTASVTPGQPDSLDFGFSNLDGPGGVLAQAYLPDDVNRSPLAGDITFDVSDPWEIGNRQRSAAFDFVYVAVHEIGHALGLDHLDVADSVMRHSVSPNTSFVGLFPTDEQQILQLYAPADDQRDEGLDPPPNDNNDTVGGDTAGGDTAGGDTAGGDTEGGENNDPENDGPDTSAQDGNRDNDGDRSEQRTRRGRRARFGGNIARNFGGRPGGAEVDQEATQVTASWHNDDAPFDVNGDGRLSVLDALLVIERLNLRQGSDLQLSDVLVMADVNFDFAVNILDAYMVVDELANPSSSASNDTSSTADAEAEYGEQDEANADEETFDEETFDEETFDEETTGEDVEEQEDETEQPQADEETDEAAETEADENDDEAENDGEDENDDEAGEGEEETDVDQGGLSEDCHRRDPFSQFDANQDQLLTPDETPEDLWVRIAAADSDQDGAVSMDELAAYRSLSRAQRKLEKWDSNQDGVITVDEVHEAVWSRLVEADLDQNLAISLEELEAIAASHPRRDPIARYDANQDGLLTIDEAPDRLWARIAAADVNNDGAIDPDELAEFRSNRTSPTGQRGGRRAPRPPQPPAS